MAVLSTMKTEKYMRLNAFHDKKNRQEMTGSLEGSIGKRVEWKYRDDVQERRSSNDKYINQENRQMCARIKIHYQT